MLQTNTQSDPIVEILRLAYRRGLAIRDEQAKEAKHYDAVHESLEQEQVLELEETMPVLPAVETVTTDEFHSK